jgi:hypothetical protein
MKAIFYRSVRLAEPNEHFARVRVDSMHQLNLLRFLVVISLIDANSVDP